MKQLSVFIAGVMLCAALFPARLSAQQDVVKITTSKATERKALTVNVELAASAAAERVMLRYRPFGQSEFRAAEMVLSGATASGTIPAEAVLPPSVEYYFEIAKRGAAATVYPLGAPQATVLRTAVGGTNPKDQEVRFLSPEPGSTVAAEDLVIAISFFYASPAVDVSKTRIFVDGVDVTAGAVVSEDVILYSPENYGRPLMKGAHFVKVELRDTTGKAYHTMDANFNLSTAAEIAQAEAELRTIGSAQLEARHEALGIGGTTYLRGDVRLDATYQSLGFGGNVHLDNQDKPERQPQNRFLVYGQTDFLRIDVGDAFPRMPSNIVSGKRVRGVTGALALGFFNLDVSAGQTDRAIEGILSQAIITYADSAAVLGRPDNTIEVAPYQYRTFSAGTFARSFLAVRPSFGSAESFQWGFTYMHSKDDVSSIKYSAAPQENTIFGTDITMAADDQRVRFETQASLSLLNADISDGSLTEEDYELMEANGLASVDDLRKVGKIVKSFITFNQYIFPTNPFGKGIPALAVDASLSLNYLGNFLRGGFFRRGASYKSFGNEFLQTDITGFIVSDNIRMLDNKVFASLSYEKKSDNTASTKEVTTDYNNLNTSFTFLLGANLPTLQIGYGLYTRKAPIDLKTRYELINRTDSATTADSRNDATNRFFVGSSYDFEAGVRHTATFSLNISDRTDKTFRKRDQNNLFVQTGLLSDIGSGIQTNFGIVYSKNQTNAEQFRLDPSFFNQDSTLITDNYNYTILTIGAQMRMLDDQMRVTASFHPTFGAYSRQELVFGVEYTPYPRHTVIFQADAFQNSGFKDDAILSLIYRLMF